MRCQLVIVLVFLGLLDDAANSQTEEETPEWPETTTYHRCHNEQQLQPGETHTRTINCGEKKYVQVHWHNTDTCMICEDLFDDYGDSQQDYSTISIECDCGCDQYIIKSGTTPSLTDNSQCNNLTIVAAMGAVLCLLLLLLAVVTTTLAWTCWLLKKRGGLTFSSDRSIRSSTDHGQLVNPTYEGDDLLRLQPSGSVPAYETIPPCPRDGAKLEFIEQGESGYHVLSRDQTANPKVTTTTCMEMILEDSREESDSSLELKEETGSTKKTSDEEYSRLERVNIGSTVPKDTCLDNDTTADSNCDNSEQTEHERKERVMDNHNNGDALQLESGDAEKGQQEDGKGKPPLITPDVPNERNDSNNTSSTDSA